MGQHRNTLTIGEMFKVRDCIIRNLTSWNRDRLPTAEALEIIHKETGIRINAHQLRRLWSQDPDLRWDAGYRRPSDTKGQVRGGRSTRALTIGKARMIWSRIKDSETGELLSPEAVKEIDSLFDEWLDSPGD